MDTRETYREIILENIEYTFIAEDKRIDRERLDEIPFTKAGQRPYRVCA